jgi:hypothetical protein
MVGGGQRGSFQKDLDLAPCFLRRHRVSIPQQAADHHNFLVNAIIARLTGLPVTV